MRSERIFRAIGDVGDDLIARADRPAQGQRAWLRWGALAACCVLVVGLAALALPHMGFGAKSAADTAGAVMQFSTTAQDNKSEPDVPAAMEMPAAAEEPAAVAPEPQPEEVETVMEEPTEEPAEADVEPAGMAKDASLPLLERNCAKIVLYYDRARVTITDANEVDTIMQALRALPLEHEDAGADKDEPILQLYLYEADAQAYYAFVELPIMRVSGAEEHIDGGEPAMDYRSEEASDLYDALVETYFGE